MFSDMPTSPESWKDREARHERTRFNELTAQVAAVNRACAYAPELHAALVLIFRPFLGKKVIKADRTLTKQAAAAVACFVRHDRGMSVSHDTSDYWLYFRILASEFYAFDGDRSGCGSSASYCCPVCVGKLEDGCLVTINSEEPKPGRSDWTVPEVQELQRAVRLAREALRTAESNLFPFKE